jgi:hypothetical protein
VAGVEERIGLGRRYAYQVLIDLAQPWILALRLVSGHGNFGDRSFGEPGRVRLDRTAGRS